MVEVNNRTAVRISENLPKRVYEKVRKGEKIKNGDLSIAFVGSGEIRKLNKKYRKKDCSTDVLSFSELGLKNLPKSIKENSAYLGEMVICPAVVKKNSKKFGSNFDDELKGVVVHGILHLLGYDHEASLEGAKKMREKENGYILGIG